MVADAGTFFVSVAMLSLIRFRHVPRARPQNWVRDLRDGWQDFWAREWFRDLVIGASVFNLLVGVYVVLGPVVSRRYYGGVGAWAVTATAAAVGSVLAGLVGAGGSVGSGAVAVTGPGGCSQPRKLGPFTVEMCWI